MCLCCVWFVIAFVWFYSLNYNHIEISNTLNASLFVKCSRSGFQKKRQSQMEICHEIAKAINLPTDFLFCPVTFTPICGREASHRSQLLLMWVFDASGVASLKVCVVVSVWASVWSKRKKAESKTTSDGAAQKFRKKPARHLCGFAIPVLAASRLRVAVLDVDTAPSDGLTFIAKPETAMQISDHN